MKNRWKLAFSVLFIFNIIVGISLFLFVRSLSVDGDFASYTEQPIEGETLLEVSSNKERLLHLIHTADIDADYEFEVDFEGERVRYDSTIAILGQQIGYSIFLTPEVSEYGNLSLYVEQVQVGFFDVPVSMILSGLGSAADFPDWVISDPGNERILVQITEIELGESYFLRLKEFNLAEDQIQMELVAK
ncbi:YpmS family protein [Alkalihalobacillus pseudalcaliphilus]|uniref:YpmS family protein n=1 Tax=Alkalihalobacillus pseudalcaliphilus TaxID=79884 RepID=UPI00064D749C|nr:YpmS family protein [Alkalihalobacillus pseudalcaliphilus]KMK75684.1 hypothetical protein AB990_10390 [Alkalihalobacillus pseudalcaliphilus]